MTTPTDPRDVPQSDPPTAPLDSDRVVVLQEAHGMIVKIEQDGKDWGRAIALTLIGKVMSEDDGKPVSIVFVLGGDAVECILTTLIDTSGKLSPTNLQTTLVNVERRLFQNVVDRSWAALRRIRARQAEQN